MCIRDRYMGNQFGGQEPGDNAAIKEFACSRYKATYPLFGKVDVNGPDADPLFTYLKNTSGSGDIKWNFGKFLVNAEGVPVKFFGHFSSAAGLSSEIEALLK
eukprot:TRINITY_DN3755_c0_g1_i1.p1 TRINITY_DN3755_c0_g1~~TRINITY_DN3755_c0_g1_i1.p1  ORF type:complete len:102 (+),score=30.20 TRINITY_DN3755_c0_g1_i1:64-369(+)